MNKFVACVKKIRLKFLGLWRSFGFRRKTFYVNSLKSQESKSYGKYLYASPVNEDGKNRLAQIIGKFGHEDFEYLVFVYDDTRFDEVIFDKCKFIYQRGIKCFFWKKFLTPEYCKKYSHLFLWDDDIDVSRFSYKNFMSIMVRNNLEIAQPSLTPDSFISHKITEKNKDVKVGRYVDYVEVMIPVFQFEAWVKFWSMLDENLNRWGNGLDLVAKHFCDYSNMGVVDQESVTHLRKVNNNPEKFKEVSEFLKKHAKTKKAVFVTYGNLK